MKKVIITYSNGDKEYSLFTSTTNEMIEDLFFHSFKTAWHTKDEEGNYTLITNMAYVRSIEILEGDDDQVEA